MTDQECSAEKARLPLGRPLVFWPVVGALLAFMAWGMFRSARLESNTWDEPAHLTHGYIYLRTGNTWIGQETPVLAPMIVAIPLLAVNPRLPDEHVSRRTYDMQTYRRLFLYRNRVKPDTLLLLGRLSVLTVTLLLGLMLALWARKRFSATVALLALFLYALDPNLTAHGKYATTDLITAAVYFLCVIAWVRYLETKRWPHLVLAGLLLGVALASKHSMIILLGLYPLLYLLRWWQQRGRFSWRHLVLSCTVAGTLAAAVVIASYGRVSWDVLVRGQGLPLAGQVDPHTRAGRLFRQAGRLLHLPNHPYLMSYYWWALRAENGHPAYLLGRHSLKGWWYFYPVVFAVKSPAGLLLGLAVCLLAAGWGLRRRRAWPRIRELPLGWMAVTVPPLFYFLLIMTSSVDVGVRHLLPVYPFLFLAVAGVLARRKLAIAAVLVMALALYENLRIQPHYTAFINLLAGGSGGAPEYVVDSNLDWGQDAKKLKTYMDSHHLGQVCLAYFGTADLDYYGIRRQPLPPHPDEAQRRALDCVGAISATYLEDVYVPAGSYAWLRRMQPIDKIGYSIYVYDLTKAGR